MEIEEASQKLCHVCRNMWVKGWAASNDGNVSARLDSGLILTTPTGVSKAEVTPDILVLMSPDGKVISGGTPSSEVKMHLRCYEERPDVNGVVHAHPPAATAFAAAGLPLAGHFLYESALNLGEVPVMPFAMPGTDAVPDSIAPVIKEGNAVLLQNHGALTVGEDVLAAYYLMETLEHTAIISLDVHILGGGIDIPPDDYRAIRNRK
jgi:L-fuculose-phosphate aldolase